MCLIFRKPAGMRFPRHLFEVAYGHNPDGFGLMYGESGRVHATRGLLSLDDSWSLYKAHEHRRLAVHFRYATQGTVSEDNVHPMQVLDADRDGMDLYMMHNGHIGGLKDGADGLSDTRVFVDSYLRPALNKHGGHVIFRQDVRIGMGKDLGPGNRLLFMDGYGRTYLVNKRRGFEIRGMWFSNIYSLQADAALPWRQPREAAAIA